MCLITTFGNFLLQLICLLPVHFTITKVKLGFDTFMHTFPDSCVDGVVVHACDSDSAQDIDHCLHDQGGLISS